MKILLCCKAGVTSNMFASALKDEASKKRYGSYHLGNCRNND